MAWDPADRAKLVAHLLEQAARCKSCGTADWEWAADPHAYEAMHRRCPGCYQREVLSEGTQPPGTSIELVPRKVAEVRHEQMRAWEQRRALEDAAERAAEADEHEPMSFPLALG